MPKYHYDCQTVPFTFEAEYTTHLEGGGTDDEPSYTSASVSNLTLQEVKNQLSNSKQYRLFQQKNYHQEEFAEALQDDSREVLCELEEQLETEIQRTLWTVSQT